MDQFEKIKHSETQAIIDLASQITPVEIGGQAHIKRVALPPGWRLEEKDDEQLYNQPYRKTGFVFLKERASFIDYVNRHKIAEHSTVYCEADYLESKISFKCIINDHAGQAEGQQWRDHVAAYDPALSEEWKRWTSSDRDQKSQIAFAAFIEENLADIAAVEGMPTGAELLEMAVSFEANQDKRYKSAIRLQSGGVNLNFVEDDDAQTLQQMKLFEKIAIGIPVFWGGDAYQLTARLRYRVTQGVLTLWYELIRPDKVVEHATKTLIDNIKTETSIPLYFGTAL